MGLPERLQDDFDIVHKPIAQWVAHQTENRSTPFFLGVNGAQGSGKSTFSDLLSAILEEMGKRVVVCSIDDFYLMRDARLRLAQTVHPLCLYRGVPGTHDVPLALETFRSLSGASPEDVTPIPRFDKARDDRMDSTNWDEVTAQPDVVIFEGWCVGATTMPGWESPYNEREAQDDPHGTWCRWSRNALLNDYQPLFESLDALLMIRVPSMETVYKSRWLQESKLWDKHQATGDKTGLKGLMTEEQTRQYVQLFERLTEHMLGTMPEQSDILIQCGDSFNYELVRLPK